MPHSGVDVLELEKNDSENSGNIARFARAEACGKAIIIGEHAVVYGARAVAMPLLSMRTAVAATRLSNPGEFRDVRDIKMFFGGKPMSEHIRSTVVDAFRTLNANPFSMRIEGAASGLVGAGLGSSAALCVVLLRAILQLLDKQVNCERLAQMANELEKRFHGSPSGLDTAVVAYERMVSFVRGTCPKITELTSKIVQGESTPWRFALIDSGLRSPTASMISAVAPYFRGSEGDRRIAAFDLAAEHSIQAICSGDQWGLAEQMKRAGAWLDEAGALNEKMRDIVRIATRFGAIAAKVTGAGGGGCVLTLWNRNTADEQLARVRASGELPWLQEVCL